MTVDLKSARVARNRTRADALFDIGLIRKLSSVEPAAVKPCLRLCDEVQHYVGKSMKLLSGHDLATNEFDPLWSESHLKQQGVFLSVLSLGYRRHPA